MNRSQPVIQFAITAANVVDRSSFRRTYVFNSILKWFTKFLLYADIFRTN